MNFQSILLVVLFSDHFSCHPPYHPSSRPKRGDIEFSAGGEERKCFFEKEPKSIYEREPRPTYSKVGKCGGSERRMSELVSEEYTNLYGSPNPAALVIARAGGEFIDWKDDAQVKELENRWICARHEQELGSRWEHKDFYHYKSNEREHRIRPVCSMPPPFFQHEHPVVLHKEVHRIEAEETQAILKKIGILLHPGLPICALHDQEARKITMEVMAEETGHALHPAHASDDSSLKEDKSDHSFRVHKKKEGGPEYAATEEGVRKAYVAFMRALGLTPHISTSSWDNLSDRSKRRQAAALKQAVHGLAAQMNPLDPTALEKKAFYNDSNHEQDKTELYEQTMITVRDAFEHAPVRADRLAYLSMISHLDLSEIQKYIHGLTRYYLTQARSYARRGFHLESVVHRRIKYMFSKVERFIRFLTSYKVTLGLPYGVRRVRDTQKRWIEIPNTLRRLRSGEIYHLYKKELTDEHETDLLLPESTIRKIVKICAAERRKSLHGVDVHVADAMEAFDNAEILLDKMLDANWIDRSWYESLRSKEAQSRQYIRTDFLIHTKEFSTVGDHCWSFGLSDPSDPDLQVDCLREPNVDWLHKHTRQCHQCEILRIFFDDLRGTSKEIEARTGTKDTQKLQEIALIKRDLDDWEDKIDRLKKHQLRTAKAEKDRLKLHADLQEGDVLYTADFAMKLLPMNPREPTTDWYGQRGMPWHVTHYTIKRNGEFYQHRAVHILRGDRQDSAVVTAIIRHNLQQLQKRGFKRVFIRSDQAGESLLFETFRSAYKSSSTICSIKAIADEVPGITVAGYYFSEASAGKGPCDRGSAIVKGHLRGYVDAKGSVLNAEQFYEGAISGTQLAGFSFYLVTVEGGGKKKEVKISTSKIPDLSYFNAFTFEEGGIRMHRSWGVGTGKIVPYTNLQANDAKLNVEKEGGKLSDEDFWQKMGDPHYKEKKHDDEHEDENTQCEWKWETKCVKRFRMESTLYRCPIESCSKEFLSLKNLDKHMDVDEHLRRPERMNIQDFALNRYASFLEIVAPPKVCTVIDDAMGSLMEEGEDTHLKMGWALSTRRAATRFPSMVKEFLKALYDEGERTGVKTDPKQAAALMRTAKHRDGTMKFQVEHLLNSRQIAGVYGRFKQTKLAKRAKVEASGSRDKREEQPEPDEVNELFSMEGDPELEWRYEPLFDEGDMLHIAVRDNKDEELWE